MNKRIERHYYIDLIRGIAFILMAIDHLIFDIAYLFNSYWGKLFPKEFYLNDIVRLLQKYRFSDISTIIRMVFIAFVFLFISGISSVLSRNILKRGLKLFLISLGLSLITIIIYLFTKNITIIIYFGILHCISISMLLTPLFKRVNKIILLIIALLIIGTGIYLSINTIYLNTNLLAPFNLTKPTFTTGDYYPVLPFMGFYILGYIFGDWYFIQKKKPRVTNNYKNNILTYFGKNTLVWYFLHQIIVVVFLVIITLVNLLFV